MKTVRSSGVLTKPDVPDFILSTGRQFLPFSFSPSLPTYLPREATWEGLSDLQFCRPLELLACGPLSSALRGREGGSEEGRERKECEYRTIRDTDSQFLFPPPFRPPALPPSPPLSLPPHPRRERNRVVEAIDAQLSISAEIPFSPSSSLSSIHPSPRRSD